MFEWRKRRRRRRRRKLQRRESESAIIFVRREYSTAQADGEEQAAIHLDLTLSARRVKKDFPAISQAV
jgi:hypothetical protein